MSNSPLDVRLRYTPHLPHPPQQAFLWLNTLDALYGGAAGGGKSDALLMAALQYADVPGYSALLLRRTFTDLSLPGAIMDRSKEWLYGTGARWSDIEKTWHFPSTATLTFGYLEHEKDKYRYQGSEYQFIGFDELTQFTEPQFRYMFSRLRKPVDKDVPASRIPIRMRGASNPGGIGHEWVKQRYLIEGLENRRVFIPARLDDNPSLDRDEYIKSLMELDPHTRRQLLEGDWDSREAGSKFKREWFEIIEPGAVPADSNLKTVRYWDLAGTKPSSASPDPDYTVGLKLSRHPNGTFYIHDVQRLRDTPYEVKKRVKHTASMDGKGVKIRVEQEPGSSGKAVIDDYIRELAGYDVKGDRPSGDKETRANPVSSQAEAGNLKIVQGQHINALLDELHVFPSTAHDDQVDALSGAFNLLTDIGTVTSTTYINSGKPPVVRRGDLTLVGDRYVDKK